MDNFLKSLVTPVQQAGSAMSNFASTLAGQPKIISPLPKEESPGGFSSPLQPGLNAYYQQEGRPNLKSQLQPQQQVTPSPTQPMTSHSLADFTTSSVPDDYQQYITQSAKKYNVPESVIASTLFTEHGFSPTPGYNYNTDGSYDRGPAQINSKAHPDITDQQALDPQFAIDFVGKELSSHYNTLKNWGKAIAAYNVGVGGATINGVNGSLGPNGKAYLKKVARGLTSKELQTLGISPSDYQ